MSILNDWVARHFHPTPAAPVPPVSDLAAERDAWAKLASLREGNRLIVYRDSLGKPTVARGHLVRPEDGLEVGDVITQAQSDAFWAKDGEDAFSHAIKLADDAGITDARFLPYLASVCYQLGDAWTGKFPKTWAMVCRGEYERAAQALEGTAWDNQTPTRVADFQAALRRLPAKVAA